MSTMMGLHLTATAQALATTTIGVLTIILVVRRKYFAKTPSYPNKLPPVVPRGGLFRTISLFLNNEFPFILLKYSRQFGSIFCLPLLSNRVVVVVADPILGRQILNDPNSTKTRAYQWMERIAGGDTFFSENGPRSRHVRKSVTPAFAPQHVERMKSLFQAHLDDWISNVFDGIVRNEKPFHVMWEMQQITTGFIVEAAFDYKMTTEQVETVLESFAICCREFASSQALNPIHKLFNRKAARQRKDAQSYLQTFAHNVLESYRTKNDPTKGTLIEFVSLDPEYESEEQRERDLLVFLFGGYETTAITLSFALLELAKNKAEQSLLHRELQKKNTLNECIESQALKNVMLETFRLHPAAAVASIRKVAKDFATGPYIIPKDSSVIVSSFLIHRNAKLFIDPDSFQPSRWNDPHDAAAAALVQFGCGPRNCIGRALANAEIQVLLARLCRDYEFSIAEEGTCGYLVTHKPVGTRLVACRRPR